MKNRMTSAFCLLCGLAAATAADGQPPQMRWSLDFGYPVKSSPALAPDGTIYITAGDGLHAVTNTGTLASNKWTLSGFVSGAVSIATDGTMYYGAGQLVALRPDGSRKWTLELKDACRSIPAIGSDGTIYVAAEGSLYAITPEGAVKWQRQFDDHGSSGDFLSPSVGTDGTIYLGAYSRWLFYAFAPDGTEKWRFELQGPSVPSAAIGGDGTVYVGDQFSFYALAEGRAVWEIPLWARGPAVVGRDGTIFVPNDNFALFSLTPGGQTNWQVAPWGIRFVSPTAAAVDRAGTVYYCVSNALFAVSREGAVLWVYEGGDPDPLYPNWVAPIIGPDGTIYAGIRTKLLAFAGTNGPGDSPWPMYRQNSRNTGKVEKPALKQPQKRSDAGFQFDLYPHELGLSYTIESSSNLNTWTSLTSFVATAFPTAVVDLDASNFPVRFYRARSP